MVQICPFLAIGGNDKNHIIYDISCFRSIFLMKKFMCPQEILIELYGNPEKNRDINKHC